MRLETRFRAAGFGLFALAAVAGAAGSAEAQINCAGLAQWSATAPPVNQWHVYCGEWDGAHNRPKGYHSRPGGLNPAGIAVLHTGLPDAQGVYSIRWEFTAHAGRWKYSTMFPDACLQAEVLTSIVYAANHPMNACPAGAPPWATCGPSRPPVGPYGGYCSGIDNSTITIAFATLNNGNVNTAFPVAQVNAPGAPGPREPGRRGGSMGPKRFDWPDRRAGDAAYERIHAFLLLDIQDDRQGADEVLARIQDAQAGKTWERVGNAYELRLRPDGAVIEDTVDPKSAVETVPLDELAKAVAAWIQSL